MIPLLLILWCLAVSEAFHPIKTVFHPAFLNIAAPCRVRSSGIQHQKASLVLFHLRSTTIINTALSLSLSPKDDSSNSTIVNSAALIAGTTIGGGFLALPRATAPAGALPSTVALVGCWLFLLMGAFALVDSILSTKDDIDITKDDGQIPSVVTVFAVAQNTFGNLGGVCVGSLFFLLMIATLVAQISKGGTMLFENFDCSRISATLMLSVLTYLFTFSFGNDFVERMNTFLTGVMLTAFAGIVSAAKGAGWQMTGLKRSNPTVFVPQFGGVEALGIASSSGPQAPWAIPIFLQLLVYTEVVPVICHRLKGDRSKIRRAIAIGSMVPLLMCICWTYVALGLVPLNVLGGGLGLPVVDPVGVMLMHGSSIHAGKVIVVAWNLKPERPIFNPYPNLKRSITLPIPSQPSFQGSPLLARLVLTLAFSAISTTIIGGYLATSQFYLDILSSIRTARNKRHNMSSQYITPSPYTAPTTVHNNIPTQYNTQTNPTTSFTPSAPTLLDSSLDSTPTSTSPPPLIPPPHTSWHFKSPLSPPTPLLCSRLLTVLPPTIIAALGSTSLYYLATAFAGAFPCTMLWGLFPSLTRRILMMKGKTGKTNRYGKLDEMIDIGMIGMSVLMIIINFLLGVHQIIL